MIKKDENKTEHVSFRFPLWLIDILNQKSAELSKEHEKRYTKTDMVIEAIVNHWHINQ